ncbi:MAG: glycosyltransferase [Sulfuricellaceae bacterium]
MIQERILVFAPHPDDEIIGCGGYLAQKCAAKAVVRVIVVSDGACGLAQSATPGLRQEESRSGLAELGVQDVRFWDYPDSAIPLSGGILAAYVQAVADFRPTRILLPATGESHPDHRRVTRGLIKALEGRWAGELWFFETTQPAPLVNTIIDVSAAMAAKLQALAAHRSQLAQYDYVGHCDSLARMRGIAMGAARGEAFLVFPWDGASQNFFEARPLISVIVRADDAQILSHALASLAAQEYDQIEVVLVWFGATPPDLSAFDVLDIRIVAGQPQRGRNLNLGITRARGEYIAFLDQDDVVYPEHLALLLAELHGRPEADVAYSGCRVVSCRRDGAQVQVGGEVTLMNRPIEAGRLLIGNLVPNNALLLRAHTFRTLRFDETLEAYEDWELLTRLELAGYRFSMVGEITCEYRLYSESATLEQSHREKGYLGWEDQVYARIVEQFRTPHLKSLAACVSQLEEREQALQDDLRKAQQTIAEQESRLKRNEEWQELLTRGLPALGIAKVGRRGLAELIGRELARETLFSVIVPVYNTPAEILSATLGAIIGQAYPAWELCLVDDASTDPGTLAVLENVKQVLQPTGKLRYLRRATQGGIVAASNDALALATAPYAAFVDHDDVPAEDALLEIALALQDHPYRLIYTDSTMIDHAGSLLHVYRKPSFSPETLLHLNFINHLSVVERELLVQLGGLKPEFEGAQDWDMLLRVAEIIDPDEICHIRQPLYGWRATTQSLAYQSSTKPAAFAAAMRAVEAHLQRIGLMQAKCAANPSGPGVVCEWRTQTRTVEIIIPTHNNLQGLKVCVAGILTATNYPDVTLTVIANRCADPDMLAYLDDLAMRRGVNLIKDERPFNWAALNNAAALHSQADLLLFMNDDVEIQHRDWLASMSRYFDLKGVGIVGATLFYPDGELQHNGVRTDTSGLVDNIRTAGAYGELRVTRNVAAVTGACLLVARDVFTEVGGFDERFAVNYNDVDFCLAVRYAGYRIVQAANATLIHHESASRGTPDALENNPQWAGEIALLRDKWGDFLADPYGSKYELRSQGTRILAVT